MPSSRRAKRAFVTLIPENVKNIYELGSGWGGVIWALAKRRKTPIYAYELSFLPWLFSVCLCRIYRLKHVKIYRKNFLFSSLKEADCVVCYLYPGAMSRLKPIFERDLKVGAYVVSNTFTVPGWKPQAVVQVGDWWGSEIWMYQKGPAERSAGPNELTLNPSAEGKTS